MRNSVRVLVASVAACFGAAGGAITAPALAQAPAPPGEIDLRPRFTQGTVARYVMEIASSNQTKTDETLDLNQDQTLTQRIGLTMRVTEASADGSTVELVYDTVKITMETPDFKAEYDSANPNPAAPPGGKAASPAAGRPPTPRPARAGRGAKPTSAKAPAKGQTDKDMDEMLGTMVRGMVGTKLTMKVDPAGNIKSVSGGDALAGGGLSSLGSLPGLAGGGGLPQASGGMSWMVGGIPTDGTARVGETWTNSDTLAGTPVGDFKMITRHTLRSHTGGTAHVAFCGHADAASAAAAPGPGTGYQLKETDYQGSYQWDTERGMLREMQSRLGTRIDGKVGEARIDLSSCTTMRVRRVG